MNFQWYQSQRTDTCSENYDDSNTEDEGFNSREEESVLDSVGGTDEEDIDSKFSFQSVELDTERETVNLSDDTLSDSTFSISSYESQFEQFLERQNNLHRKFSGILEHQVLRLREAFDPKFPERKRFRDDSSQTLKQENSELSLIREEVEYLLKRCQDLDTSPDIPVRLRHWFNDLAKYESQPEPQKASDFLQQKKKDLSVIGDNMLQGIENDLLSKKATNKQLPYDSEIDTKRKLGQAPTGRRKDDGSPVFKEENNYRQPLQTSIGPSNDLKWQHQTGFDFLQPTTDSSSSQPKQDKFPVKSNMQKPLLMDDYPYSQPTSGQTPKQPITSQPKESAPIGQNVKPMIHGQTIGTNQLTDISPLEEDNWRVSKRPFDTKKQEQVPGKPNKQKPLPKNDYNRQLAHSQPETGPTLKQPITTQQGFKGNPTIGQNRYQDEPMQNRHEKEMSPLKDAGPFEEEDWLSEIGKKDEYLGKSNKQKTSPIYDNYNNQLPYDQHIASRQGNKGSDMIGQNEYDEKPMVNRQIKEINNSTDAGSYDWQSDQKPIELRKQDKFPVQPNKQKPVLVNDNKKQLPYSEPATGPTPTQLIVSQKENKGSDVIGQNEDKIESMENRQIKEIGHSTGAGPLEKDNWQPAFEIRKQDSYLGESNKQKTLPNYEDYNNQLPNNQPETGATSTQPIVSRQGNKGINTIGQNRYKEEPMVNRQIKEENPSTDAGSFEKYDWQSDQRPVIRNQDKFPGQVSRQKPSSINDDIRQLPYSQPATAPMPTQPIASQKENKGTDSISQNKYQKEPIQNNQMKEMNTFTEADPFDNWRNDQRLVEIREHDKFPVQSNTQKPSLTTDIDQNKQLWKENTKQRLDPVSKNADSIDLIRNQKAKLGSNKIDQKEFSVEKPSKKQKGTVSDNQRNLMPDQLGFTKDKPQGRAIDHSRDGTTTSTRSKEDLNRQDNAHAAKLSAQPFTYAKDLEQVDDNFQLVDPITDEQETTPPKYRDIVDKSEQKPVAEKALKKPDQLFTKSKKVLSSNAHQTQDEKQSTGSLIDLPVLNDNLPSALTPSKYWSSNYPLSPSHASGLQQFLDQSYSEDNDPLISDIKDMLYYRVSPKRKSIADELEQYFKEHPNSPRLTTFGSPETPGMSRPLTEMELDSIVNGSFTLKGSDSLRSDSSFCSAREFSSESLETQSGTNDRLSSEITKEKKVQKSTKLKKIDFDTSTEQSDKREPLGKFQDPAEISDNLDSSESTRNDLPNIKDSSIDSAGRRHSKGTKAKAEKLENHNEQQEQHKIITENVKDCTLENKVNEGGFKQSWLMKDNFSRNKSVEDLSLQNELTEHTSPRTELLGKERTMKSDYAKYSSKHSKLVKDSSPQSELPKDSSLQNELAKNSFPLSELPKDRSPNKELAKDGSSRNKATSACFTKNNILDSTNFTGPLRSKKSGSEILHRTPSRSYRKSEAWEIRLSRSDSNLACRKYEKSMTNASSFARHSSKLFSCLHKKTCIILGIFFVLFLLLSQLKRTNGTGGERDYSFLEDLSKVMDVHSY